MMTNKIMKEIDEAIIERRVNTCDTAMNCVHTTSY